MLKMTDILFGLIDDFDMYWLNKIILSFLVESMSRSKTIQISIFRFFPYSNISILIIIIKRQRF